MLNENNMAKAHSIRRQFQEIAQHHKEQDLQRGLHLKPECYTSREVFNKHSSSVLKPHLERTDRRFLDSSGLVRSPSKPADAKASLADLNQKKILLNR